MVPMTYRASKLIAIRVIQCQRIVLSQLISSRHDISVWDWFLQLQLAGKIQIYVKSYHDMVVIPAPYQLSENCVINCHQIRSIESVTGSENNVCH